MYGGIPSPNPSYPQPIKVVTGDNSVVVQNKNIFNKNTVVTGALVSNGTINSDTNYFTSDFIKYNNTLFASWSERITDDYLRVGIYDKDKNFIRRDLITLASTDRSYLLNLADTYYIKISLYNNVLNTLQVEVGTVATDYVAHQEQSTTLHLGDTYLGGIGENKDYIDPDTKKKIGIIDYIVLDGSEDEEWQQISGTFRINKEDLGMELAADSLDIKCNQYIFQSETPTDIGQARVGASKLIFKYDDGTTTLEDFRTWLSNNNLIIYWVLNTPFEQAITDSTLLEELEVLNNMRSYDGTTNITVTSDDANVQMEVEVTYTSESDMNERLTYIFDRIKSKLYHIVRAL